MGVCNSVTLSLCHSVTLYHNCQKNSKQNFCDSSNRSCWHRSYLFVTVTPSPVIVVSLPRPVTIFPAITAFIPSRIAISAIVPSRTASAISSSIVISSIPIPVTLLLLPITSGCTTLSGMLSAPWFETPCPGYSWFYKTWGSHRPYCRGRRYHVMSCSRRRKVWHGRYDGGWGKVWHGREGW